MTAQVYPALLLGIVVSSYASAGRPPEQPVLLHLLAHYDFSDISQMDDWIAEGPAELRIQNGRLHLESAYREDVTSRLTDAEIRAANGTDEKIYRDILVPLLESTDPQALKGYQPGSPIRFGHTVLWNKRPLPNNYVIEYTFRNESPYPLHLLHFSASGQDGQSIFSPELSPRTGVAAQYMFGDIRTYRLSYFSGNRGTINMRKAPGRLLIGEVPDKTIVAAGSSQSVRLTKHGSRIRFAVNGEPAFVLDDPEPLGGGYWGFRLMLLAASSYDDIRVFAIGEAPSNRPHPSAVTLGG